MRPNPQPQATMVTLLLTTSPMTTNDQSAGIQNIQSIFHEGLFVCPRAYKSGSFFKKGHSRPLFFIYFRPLKPTLQFLQQINVKTSIQYTVLEFEHTTYRIRVSSHNHQARALTLKNWIFKRSACHLPTSKLDFRNPKDSFIFWGN